MSDERTRDRARAAAASNDPQAAAQVLRDRLRHGTLASEHLDLAAYAGDPAALLAACGRCPVGNLVGQQCGLRPGPVLAACPSRMTPETWFSRLSGDGLLVSAVAMLHMDPAMGMFMRGEAREQTIRFMVQWIGHVEQFIHAPRERLVEGILQAFAARRGDSAGVVWRRDLFVLLRLVVRAFALRGFIPTTLCTGQHHGNGQPGCPRAAHHHHDGQGDCPIESDEALARVFSERLP